MVAYAKGLEKEGVESKAFLGCLDIGLRPPEDNPAVLDRWVGAGMASALAPVEADDVVHEDEDDVLLFAGPAPAPALLPGEEPPFPLLPDELAIASPEEMLYGSRRERALFNGSALYCHDEKGRERKGRIRAISADGDDGNLKLGLCIGAFFLNVCVCVISVTFFLVLLVLGILLL